MQTFWSNISSVTFEPLMQSLSLLSALIVNIFVKEISQIINVGMFSKFWTNISSILSYRGLYSNISRPTVLLWKK